MSTPFRPCLLLGCSLPDRDPETRIRIRAVVRAYKNNRITDIYITTWYEVADVNIGIETVRYLHTEMDVPLSAIHYYPYGSNTAGEVAGFSFYLKLEDRWREGMPVWFCTSNFHLPRAKMLLQQQQFNPISIPAGYPENLTWRRRFKELVCFCKDSLPWKDRFSLIDFKKIENKRSCQVITAPMYSLDKQSRKES